jgi:hypothetical protein
MENEMSKKKLNKSEIQLFEDFKDYIRKEERISYNFDNNEEFIQLMQSDCMFAIDGYKSVIEIKKYRMNWLFVDRLYVGMTNTNEIRVFYSPFANVFNNGIEGIDIAINKELYDSFVEVLNGMYESQHEKSAVYCIFRDWNYRESPLVVVKYIESGAEIETRKISIV